jgi:sarcosine oxidase subunit delta
MKINHPLLGLRCASEFVIKGDAKLINRPNYFDDSALNAFHDYLYIRENPAGEHRELWFHEHGDRSWLIVTRDTCTHEIKNVELAYDFLLKENKDK